MKPRLKLKGHKLTTEWTGCESTYANGRCECGHWFSRGWTTKMRSVRISHQGHLARLIDGRGTPGFDLPKVSAKPVISFVALREPDIRK